MTRGSNGAGPPAPLRDEMAAYDRLQPAVRAQVRDAALPLDSPAILRAWTWGVSLAAPPARARAEAEFRAWLDEYLALARRTYAEDIERGLKG